MSRTVIDFTVDIDDLVDLVKDFEATPKIAEQAMRAAINRTVDYIRVQFQRRNLSDLAFKSKAIRKRLRGAYFQKGKLARIWFGYKPLDLMDAKPGPRQTKRGVRAGRQFYPSAFLATQREGSRSGVFIRKDKRRLPIIRLGQPIDEKGDELIDFAEENWLDFFWKRFEHELRFRTAPGKQLPFALR